MSRWQKTKEGGFARVYRGYDLSIKPVCSRWRAFVGSDLVGVYGSCYEACITVESIVRRFREPPSHEERAIALQQSHQGSRIFSVFIAINAIRWDAQDPCDDCLHWIK